MSPKLSGESLSLCGYFAHDDFLCSVGYEDLDDCETDGAAAEDEDGGVCGSDVEEWGCGDGVPGYGKGFD
jgi:hypothetical protein